MTPKVIVGVMGPGEAANPEENEVAYELGKAIAKEGWAVLTGGREFGVMNAVMKGAVDHNGLTIGILPTENAAGSSRNASIRIITGMGSARNNIAVLTSHVIVVCGMAPGTASAVALAVKAQKKIILLRQDEETVKFFKKLGTYRIHEAQSVEETINHIRDLLSLKQIL